MDWITDKLPEALGNYLVTVKVTDKHDNSEPYYFVAIDHYNGCGRWTTHNKKSDKIIAWMNVPDVYEEYAR